MRDEHSVTEPLMTELLTRSVVHELRQPLSLVVGYSELLANASLDDPERALLLAELRAAALRLASSLARIERMHPIAGLATVVLGGTPILDLDGSPNPRAV